MKKNKIDIGCVSLDLAAIDTSDLMLLAKSAAAELRDRQREIVRRTAQARAAGDQDVRIPRPQQKSD